VARDVSDHALARRMAEFSRLDMDSISDLRHWPSLQSLLVRTVPLSFSATRRGEIAQWEPGCWGSRMALTRGAPEHHRSGAPTHPTSFSCPPHPDSSGDPPPVISGVRF
jgi:hypothetical protein